MQSIYRLFDINGALLYIGYSANLKRRLEQHERYSDWFDLAETVEVEDWSNVPRLSCFAIEAAAIGNESPRFNVNSKTKPTPHIQWLMECADRSEKIRAMRRAGKTTRDIAETFSLSRQRVHQILNSEVGSSFPQPKARNRVSLADMKKKARQKRLERAQRLLAEAGEGDRP